MDLPRDGFGRRVVLLDKIDPKHKDTYLVLDDADGSVRFCLAFDPGTPPQQAYDAIHKTANAEWMVQTEVAVSAKQTQWLMVLPDELIERMQSAKIDFDAASSAVASVSEAAAKAEG